MSVIQISRSTLDDMLAHAESAAPKECCGLLIGSAARVERAVRARNLRESATRFLVDPAAHFAAIKAARAEGATVVGVYHSHPSSAPVPSDRDLAEAAYPEYLYVIVVPRGPDRSREARAFRLVEGQFRSVELMIV